MSIEVMSLAWYVGDLTPAQKAVLVALADHANEDGRHAYPGVERLTYKTSFAERTVRRALSDLRAMGLIRVVRAAKHHRSTEYEIDLSEMQARQNRPARDAPQEESDLPENTGDLPESANRPARDAPKPSVNHQLEPSGAAARAGEIFTRAETHFGGLNATMSQKIQADIDDYGLLAVEAALGEAEKNDARKWEYVTTILERWKSEGRGPRDRQNGQIDLAKEAWTVVEAAIKKGRADPIMERPDVLQTLNKVGRWLRVKNASEREISFIKKEFIEAYHE